MDRRIEPHPAETGGPDHDGHSMITELTVAALGVALAAGTLSFLSPCVLPLMPAYLSFITGMSLEELSDQDRARRRTVLIHALLFIGGFSLVFILLGASATYVGSFLRYFGRWIEIGGGVLVILFGLFLLGLLRLPGGQREFRVHLANKPLGKLGTIVVGITFAAGWTPCIGPVLGGILTLAATRDGVMDGMGLLSAYSVGLAIPFLLSAVAFDRFLLGKARFRRWLPWVNRIAGGLLVLIGLLLLTGSFTWLAERLAAWTPAFLLERM